MRNIYSPADIEKVLESILGSNSELEKLQGEDLDNALQRRAEFIGAVGRACATEVMRERGNTDTRVVVFAGDAINGAYAIDTAIALYESGCPVELYLINIGGDLLKPDTKAARSRFLATVGEEYLFETVDLNVRMPEMTPDMIVVDGLFGREYKTPLRGGYQAMARLINEKGAKVISIDLPSGMSPELAVGMVNRNIVHATLTLTLVGPTLAFYMPENAELLGRWKTLHLPYPREILKSIKCNSRLVDGSGIRAVLPRRNPFYTKADLGSVLLYAGSYGMLGAAVLAARGALRSGCGKVTVHSARCGYYVLQTSVPCAMFETDGGDMDIRHFESTIEADAIAVGPGIGRSEATLQGLEHFLKVMNSAKQPVVLDADALNCIAMRPSMLEYIPPRSVLTPHAGEFDRIFGPQPSSSARLLKAIEVSTRYQIVIVLKSHYTQTVWPGGAVAVNSSGTEALATAGAGDVLTGLLAGFIAQRLKPEIAAVAAVFVHGIAGRMAAEENGIYGTTSEDIANAIGPAIEAVLTGAQNNKQQVNP